MKLYERSAVKDATRYPCSAIVTQSKHFARPCRRRAVVLFVEDNGAVKACACNIHREQVRNAFKGVS